jgi:hypothetical protein
MTTPNEPSQHDFLAIIEQAIRQTGTTTLSKEMVTTLRDILEKLVVSDTIGEQGILRIAQHGQRLDAIRLRFPDLSPQSQKVLDSAIEIELLAHADSTHDINADIRENLRQQVNDLMRPTVIQVPMQDVTPHRTYREPWKPKGCGTQIAILLVAIVLFVVMLRPIDRYTTTGDTGQNCFAVLVLLGGVYLAVRVGFA